MTEGDALDERTVNTILDRKPVLGGGHDIFEVGNARHIYDLIPKLDPYSIDNLPKAHRMMMKDLVPEAGRLHNGNIGVFDGSILTHVDTPVAHVPEMIVGIFGWPKETNVHPLLTFCVSHFEFEFCRLLLSGNGRTGRSWRILLLSGWRPVLVRLSIKSTIKRRQAGYYEALTKSDVAGLDKKFVEFILDTIGESLLPLSRPGGERELAWSRALDFFGKHNDGEVSQLAETLGCSERNTERMVTELKEEGILLGQGSTRPGIWIIHK